MKTLLILRHAKAVPATDHQPDFDRALAARGESDAPRIGQLLVEQNLVPELILSSAAQRAKQTAELVAAAAGFAGRLELLGELYMALPQTYIDALRREGNSLHRAMVVGHNPTLDQLLYLLTGSRETFPTAGLAVIDLKINAWSELVIPSQHQLVEFYRPKQLD
jgi:phosphohistidine phosphatase